MSLDKDYKFFESVIDKLVEEHRDEYVLIKDEDVVDFFPDEESAMRAALKNNELGEFIVQKCIPADQDIKKFHTRVAFS